MEKEQRLEAEKQERKNEHYISLYSDSGGEPTILALTGSSKESAFHVSRDLTPPGCELKQILRVSDEWQATRVYSSPEDDAAFAEAVVGKKISCADRSAWTEEQKREREDRENLFFLAARLRRLLLEDLPHAPSESLEKAIGKLVSVVVGLCK